jgi:hypothetical protein
VLQIALLLLLWIAAVTFLIKLIIRWAALKVSRQMESRHRAAEAIINQGRVPEAWIGPFRDRIDAIRSNGGTNDDVERIGRRAQKLCLREIDSLIGFFEKGGFVDGSQTRRTLLESLRERRDAWAAGEWPVLMELDLKS